MVNGCFNLACVVLTPWVKEQLQRRYSAVFFAALTTPFHFGCERN
jgi:hypothetical protein